ncbi:ATP-dependent DNA helicase [Salinispora oceanensis]|uniref:hypothetical protein n=1 Tax=Salinispora oceanensis TaxID=1050199 RepID=UPI0003A6423C|nr:hypothetical protein [Salinispora oceanensis]
MSGTGPGLQELAAQVACALAEALCPATDTAGRHLASLDHAHMFASGRVDLWDGWEHQPDRVRRLVGRFLRIRNNELGSYARFIKTARDLVYRPDSPYGLPADIPRSQVGHLLPRHGQQPLDLAEQLIGEAEVKYLQSRRPHPVASAGRWTFGLRGESVVELPSDVATTEVIPLVVATAPTVDEVKAGKEELFALADELDGAGRGDPWQRNVLETLFDGVRDADDATASDLLLRSGKIRLFNAPTGVGKSVLTRLLAILLARRGIQVAVVVGTINEAQNTADSIAEQDALARGACAKLSDDLHALGSPLRCATLIAASRVHEKAVHAASRDEWDRFDRLAYGCALPAWLVDGPPPENGNEPCTSLLPQPGSDDPAAKSGKPKRHVCPRLSACDRHRVTRDAVSADIIVTNHHNLIHGTVRLPVSIDGETYARISVLELVMRRCPVLVIDEIDRFQSSMFDSGARQLIVAANTGLADLPLTQLNAQRVMLLPGQDRNVLPPLSRTTFLADQFLNYVLEGDLWLEAARWLDNDEYRNGSGWHIPGSNDRLLLMHLFGIDQATDEVPREVYGQFNALFPDNNTDDEVSFPRDMAAIAARLRTVISNDDGIDRIREVKDDLHPIVGKVLRATARKMQTTVPDGGEEQTPEDASVRPSPKSDRRKPTKEPTHDEIRREVVNALLVRTWLGALHQSLTALTYAVGAPDTDLPAARALIEQLGTFVQHATIPYGPLGYLLFGFRIDRAGDGLPRGQLSVQAIAGDPHTTVTQLGDAVALSAAGTRRIVVGLSATAFFPGAAREHIHAGVAYAMTDAAPGAFTTLPGQALDGDRALSVGGQLEHRKADLIQDLGRMLWEQRLDQHLRTLAETEPKRERCLLVSNSYPQAALLGASIARLVAEPGWVAVVVPKEPRLTNSVIPSGVVQITVDDLEDLPRKYPAVKVCTAPLSLVARGLNILVPGTQRSALASIWVCVRPVLQLNAPAEILASVNATALAVGEPGQDSALVLAAQRRAAFRRLFTLLSSDPRFSRLPRYLKAEAIAGMLVDLIQLAGRARRGGTPVRLYLVDNAFHDATLGSDLPSLLRYYYSSLPPHDQTGLDRIYGSTLGSWLEFAGIDYTASGA